MGPAILEAQREESGFTVCRFLRSTEQVAGGNGDKRRASALTLGGLGEPMVIDSDLIKRLNLLRTSPGWVFKALEDGSMEVLKPDSVPAGDGFYWIGGETTTASGNRIPSVFVVDTDSGAEQCGVFWFVAGDYYEHSESALVAESLGIDATQFFPYSWKYSVTVLGDVHS